MLSAAGLIVAVVAMVGLPAVLAAGTWATRRPRLALLGWVGAVVVGIVGLNVSVLSWLLPVPVWERTPADAGAILAWVVGGIAFATLIAGLSVVLGRAEEQWRRDAATRAAMVRALAGSQAYDGPPGVHVRVLPNGPASAWSTRCHGNRVMIGSGLADRLSPDELAAVIAHECAHLSGWHDRVLFLAQVNAASFPWIPGARSFAARVNLLIELAADDRAAELCGPEPVVRALRLLSEIGEVPGAEQRADRLSSRSSRRAAAA